MKKLHDFAIELSHRAGDLLMKGFRSQSLNIAYKSRTDLVTSMDNASEELIVSAIHGLYPDHSIIAEEGRGFTGSGDYIWYVDPLDGTNNYAHGIPIFCVSLGVYSRSTGKVLCGVVHDPNNKETFSALHNKGAWLNGSAISVSETKTPGYGIVATGFPYDKENPAVNNVDRFQKIVPHVQGIRRFGSAALDLCFVACGRIDGYWEGELKPWDLAAGSLIVQEAHGQVTRFNGEAFDVTRGEVCATNGAIHHQLLALLSY